jgi:hypothetical protein
VAAFGLALATHPRVALPAPAPVDPVTLQGIRDAAMTSDWGWQHLAALTDGIGPRLSGSPQLAAAVTQLAGTMRTLGAQVTLQPVKVPHWVRGDEQGELVDYPDRPAGTTQRLSLTALGSSAATLPGGLTARIIVVHDFGELEARSREVRGNIVLFESRFDRRLADGGFALDAYVDVVKYRAAGPAAAAALGAAAALIRSISGASYRLPHTGNTVWKEKQTPIPAAALAAEDADLIERLAAAGPVTVKLLLTPRTLPDADSSNVIADWVGHEIPGEYVIVSGHLDSWDLATGATDDGVGVIAAASVIAVLEKLGLHARRTIRFVGWTNEENGGRGGRTYRDSVGKTLGTQVAAIENDEGAGPLLGIKAAVTRDSLSILQPVLDTLRPLGAATLSHQEGEVGSDIELLQRVGVPGFAPLVDMRHYFDYHHSAADTLDKVEPHNLRSQVAAMAVLAYYLAELPEQLPRFSISNE